MKEKTRGGLFIKDRPPEKLQLFVLELKKQGVKIERVKRK